MAKEKSPSEKKGEAPCACPFCDAPTDQAYPFCKACGKDLRRCPVCGKALAQDQDTCPECKG
jgi:predicted amidophosphoribosyltransferase